MQSPDNLANDSFDKLIASLEEPTDILQAASSVVTTTAPSEPKKSKLSNQSEQNTAAAAAANASTTTTTDNKPSIQQVSNKPNRAHCVLVNPKQRGNPILKSITNVPWEFDDTIIPDYVVGTTAGILFLSLRYHQLNPDYIHNRLKELGKRFELRILLVQVDTKVGFHHHQSHYRFQIHL